MAAIKQRHRRHGAEQPDRAGLGQPRRADRPRRAQHPVVVAMRELADEYIASASGSVRSTQERRDAAPASRSLSEEARDEPCRPSRQRPSQPAVADRATTTATGSCQRRPRRRIVDPFAAVKARVHQALIDSLGPQLYDPHLDRGRARSPGAARRSRRSSTPSRPRSRTPTAPGSPRRSPTRSSATGRSSRCCATPRSPRSWSTAPTTSTSSAPARSTRSTPHFSTDAHLRRTIDKIVGRVGRRIDEASPLVDARLPDGSRVNAVDPADRPRRRRC